MVKFGMRRSAGCDQAVAFLLQGQHFIAGVSSGIASQVQEGKMKPLLLSVLLQAPEVIFR